MVDEFGNKSYLFDDMEKELKILSHIEKVILKKNLCRLEESNTQLGNEVSNLQASINEIRVEVSLLQEDKNHMFDEYKALKEEYYSVLLQLSEKDKTIQGLQECKQNLEYQVC
jgi:predicted nuclease with TOPRIM domain